MFEKSIVKSIYKAYQKGNNKFISDVLQFEIDAYDNGGHTLLHYASSKGLLTLVPILIQNGADVNSVNSRYNATPLHFACKMNNMQMVSVLLKHGADANLRDSLGCVPLEYAYENMNKELVDLLHEYTYVCV